MTNTPSTEATGTIFLLENRGGMIQCLHDGSPLVFDSKENAETAQGMNAILVMQATDPKALARCLTDFPMLRNVNELPAGGRSLWESAPEVQELYDGYRHEQPEEKPQNW